MFLLKQKIKSHKDFVVEEVMELPSLEGGSYAYYLLKKQNCGTLAVIQDLIERLKISRDRIGFSGLKDTKAITTQYISIKDGPAKDIKSDKYSLFYLGQGKEPIFFGQAKGNVFTITLRDVDVRRLKKFLMEIKEIGFPNYFGEQRFASELYTSRPIATYLIQKDYEGALREYLCHHHKPSERRRLLKLWKQPQRFLRESKNIHSRLDFIALKVYVQKKNPERALRVLPKSVKLIFLFAYQSLLWNEILSRFIKKICKTWFQVPFVKGKKITFYKKWEDALNQYKNYELPFVSSKMFDADLSEDLKEVFLEVIHEEMKKLNIKDLKEFLETETLSLKVFNPGERRMIIFPEDLLILKESKRLIKFRFFLPTGSYATVLLSWIFSRSVLKS